MQVKIKPAKLSGEVYAIASKSDAHRAIICAALSDDKTNIHISHISKDIEATLNCIRAMGADYTKSENVYTVIPINAPAKNPTLDCGESGSTLRFLLPVISALGNNATFTGHGRLPQRPIGLILDLLKGHGNEFSSDSLPVTVCGKTNPGNFEIAGNVSSQFISGLLFALPLLHKESKIVITSKLESSAYVDMTLNTLNTFGADIQRYDNGFTINPIGLYKSPKEYLVEGDWSNAAFFLVMGALMGNMSVKNLDMNSYQSDKKILDILTLAGAEVNLFENEIKISSNQIKPFEFDVSQCPDLFPVISVLACGAKGTSRLYNAERLRIKESDRIKTTKELILSLGGKAEETKDSLIIYGNGKLEGGNVNSFNDHRIAMSAFVASTICENDIVLEDVKAIDKSYPSFIKDFESIGGNVNVI